MMHQLTGNETLYLPVDEPIALQRAVDCLLAGGLVAFPTDTVYGLGALVWNEASIRRIYAAKERPPEKAIPVLVADIAAARRLVAKLPATAEALATHFWPGPLTLVVPCGDGLPEFLTSGSGTVALRVPDHPVTLRLLALLGQPLAVTSANRSGLPSPLTAQEVLDQLAGRIDAVVDGGPCPGGQPSTVVSLVTEPPILLRAGPIDIKDLAEASGAGGFGVRIAD
jgi:L-threonylcarbamoyladenylate synthase